MRILIVSPTLNYGGAERVASLWADGFIRNGHEVYFVTNIEKNAAYSTSAPLLPLTPSHGTKIYRYIKSVFLLRSYYSKYQPDIVIGVMYACSLLAKVASVGYKTQVICTEHNSFERPVSAPMTKLDWFLKYKVNKLYKCVTVLTEADKQFIGKRLKNVVVMPNPLALTPTRQIPEKRKTVLAAGRLDVWHTKGFDVLIQAWSKIVSGSENQASGSQLDGWRLLLAGTGSEESQNYLKQLCKDNGVEDSVEFLGFQKDVEKMYQNAEIFVLSSRYEGFGLVLIEAMSQGCACVACDYKGRQREIIQDDSQGLVCEPDNVEALADALAKVMTNEKYRKEIQENAIERSKYYSI